MAYEYERINNIGCVTSAISTDQAVEELQEVYRKAKAFDEFLKYKQHVEKYNNSDCHELERVFQGVMKEYEEDE